MRSCVPLLATLALTTCYVYASPLVCVIFCSRGEEFPFVRTPGHCDCPSVKIGDLLRFDRIRERAAERNHTHLSQTTPAPSVTTDICDYLCSIQLGGDACHCSIPGLPGRK